MKLPPSDKTALSFKGFNNGFYSYLRQYHSPAIYVVTLATIFSELVIIVFYADSARRGNGVGIGLLGLVTLVLYVGWLYLLSQSYLASNLSAFAVANGFVFDPHGNVDLSPSSLSRVGESRKVYDVVNGSVSGRQIQLFLCNVVVLENAAISLALEERQRNEETFYTTVLDIAIAGHLPRLLLVNHQTGFDKLNIAKGFVTQNVISLEGDFDRFFKLYVEPGNEVEALEVFSPDTMELMENESKNFSVEFVDGHIYLYMYKPIKTVAEVTAMFGLAAHLTTKIAPVAGRMEPTTD